MTACIDYFGARNVQREATASGSAAGSGDTWEAVGYGAETTNEIGLSATARWTGGGGARAVGVRLNEVGWYELGSQTIRGEVYQKLAAQDLGEDKVMLGWTLAKKYGWAEALFHWRKLAPTAADWRLTFPPGADAWFIRGNDVGDTRRTTTTDQSLPRRMAQVNFFDTIRFPPFFSADFFCSFYVLQRVRHHFGPAYGLLGFIGTFCVLAGSWYGLGWIISRCEKKR